MKKTIFLIFFYIFNCELFTIANHLCSNYNAFGYCTEIKRHLPKFETFRPKGLRITVDDTPGLQGVSFKANINKHIERDDKGDIHFDFQKKNGKWTHYTENVDLKVGNAINFFLKVRENNKDLNYEKKRILVKSLEPSPFIKTPTNNPAVLINQKPGNNQCACCPAGGHGSASATASAAASVTVNVNRPVINQNTNKKPNNPPPPHQPTRPPSNQQIKNTTPAARSAATTKSPQQEPIDSAGAGEVTNPHNHQQDASTNFCSVTDLIEMVIKLEKAETKIESLTEVLEYLLTETKIVNGKQLFYSLSKPPGPTDNALYTIQSLVGDSLDMMDLEKQIQQAKYVDGGILFEVQNNIDKLRILFRAKQVLISSVNKITDPEPMSTTNLIDIITKPTTAAPSGSGSGGAGYDQLFQNVFSQPSGTDQQQEASNSDIDESFWRIDSGGIKVPMKKSS